MLAVHHPQTSVGVPDPLACFQAERPRLLRIARRILRGGAEAEDVVQDAFIRWHRVDAARVECPAAFPALTVTRLALNASRAAHRRRVDYVGVKMMEVAGAAHPVDADCGRAWAVSAALLRLARELTPVERAVLLLHECFAYLHAEIAAIVGKTEANCRQIQRRARQRLAAAATRRHAPSPSAGHDRLEALFRRAAAGDTHPLAAFLGAEARASAAQKRHLSPSPRRAAPLRLEHAPGEIRVTSRIHPRSI
ncbi:MAG TPA: sigma-70 family RNA polymerase sigma factor [Longimicrobium sp.]|jgi:RNA polymerase sigma-70 factor (ECF subfamily)